MTASGWVKLPRAWNERRRDLPSAVQAVYVDLLYSADRSWKGSLTVRGIADRCGISKSTASASLATLAAAGVIDYRPGSNQYAGTRYVLLLNADGVLSQGQRVVFQRWLEGHQSDSTSNDEDSSRTADTASPAAIGTLERLRYVQEWSRGEAGDESDPNSEQTQDQERPGGIPRSVRDWFHNEYCKSPPGGG